MKFVPMPTLHTPRLILRRVQMGDLPDYHCRLTSDPEVAKGMLWEATSDISHTEGTIRRILAGYERGDRYHWAIAGKEDNRLIGTIALVGFEPERDSASFAYMLGRDFWNQGFGTEALGAVMGFAFGQMEIARMTADHFADNPASGAVMGKLGMRKMGLIPKKYEKSGVFHDAVSYTITATITASEFGRHDVS